MSKIQEYQLAVRKKVAEKELQTIGDFAVELKKSPSILLKQLKEAGVPKFSATDFLTSKDKTQLLTHLHNSHRTKESRKEISITLDPECNKLMRRVAAQENGAEFEALNFLLATVLTGEKIDPKFQKLINLIVAKAVLIGALPMRRLGRPKLENLDVIGLNAAVRYWEMIDSDVTYEVAVEKLSVEFHKSERHIMRLIAKHKNEVGETIDVRATNRRRREMMRGMHSQDPSPLERVTILLRPEIPVPEFTFDDYMEHLEELIGALAASAKPLTKKIRN